MLTKNGSGLDGAVRVLAVKFFLTLCLTMN